MHNPINHAFAVFAVAGLLAATTTLHAGEEGITWLATYEGGALPGSGWTANGKVNATIDNGALHLVDDSADFGNYRAAWRASPQQEIVVEAKVKVNAVTGSQKKKPATSLWPWRDGAPVSMLVSDGRHQEGLAPEPPHRRLFLVHNGKMDPQYGAVQPST